MKRDHFRSAASTEFRENAKTSIAETSTRIGLEKGFLVGTAPILLSGKA